MCRANGAPVLKWSVPRPDGLGYVVSRRWRFALRRGWGARSAEESEFSFKVVDVL
jgi:hypothetical protein